MVMLGECLWIEGGGVWTLVVYNLEREKYDDGIILKILFVNLRIECRIIRYNKRCNERIFYRCW